jgi:hypothetical protein
MLHEHEYQDSSISLSLVNDPYSMFILIKLRTSLFSRLKPLAVVVFLLEHHTKCSSSQLIKGSNNIKKIHNEELQI